MKAIVAGVAVLIVSGVLAYGYRFGVTHGSLYITAMDISDREHPREARPVQLLFRDSTGKVLAQAAAAETGDPVSVTSPAIYSCREWPRESALAAPCSLISVRRVTRSLFRID